METDMIEVHPTLFNPFVLWTDLAMKSTEMAVESGQVLGTRVDQIARAGAHPSPRDMKEQTLIGSSDQMKAAADSGINIVAGMQSAALQVMAQAWQHWFTTLSAMASLAGSKTFGEALSRQEQLFNSLNEAGRQTAERARSTARDVTHRATQSAASAGRDMTETAIDATAASAQDTARAHAKRTSSGNSRTTVAASKRRVRTKTAKKR
jgi:hypothetical protein